MNIFIYVLAEAFDVEAIYTALKDLKKGGGVDLPIYDFKTHTRSNKCQRVIQFPQKGKASTQHLN